MKNDPTRLDQILHIQEKIDAKYRHIEYCSECEERTIKMYPPDGWGHGYDWRKQINYAYDEINKLQASINAPIQELNEIYSDNSFEKICNIFIPDFKEINLELIEYFSKNPDKLSILKWRDFEKLLEAVFRNQGFHTELGPGCGDEGVDLRLIRKDAVGEIITLVQAKKYKAENPIRLEAVQALYAVVEDQKASRGLFVTTSRYLPSAERFAERQRCRLTLAKAEDVARWCSLYSERKP